MREYNIPALADVPATATLTDVVADRAGSTPDAVIMRRRLDRGQWSDVTARQFYDEVRELARGVIAAGIQAGDRVGVMSRTSYEWILSDSGARGVFAETDAHVATITSVKGELPDLENIWLIDTIGVLTARGSDVGDEHLDQRMAGRAQRTGSEPPHQPVGLLVGNRSRGGLVGLAARLVRSKA